ncbi:MAG TPA: phosphoribosylformylglycinamidine cyclo-ligase [Dictyobacter sp.]|jgi:phosphoribosylformylglycinamidine synthase I|nr:phosphoribosylformylglycinamidine cyclo-ligase [Dictyobacter sp.]
MNAPRALVLRAPGINCDREAAHACRLAGFETEAVHINQLIKAPEQLLNYQFLVFPGGFSYGDDLGAGTLLAKKLELHLGEQLRQFVAEGRPVLGICNGFQVLVRLGLLPGKVGDQAAHATLTDNELARFECRWITMTTQNSPCIFTRDINVIEMPVAHGEGQFVLAGNISIMKERGQIPLVYSNPQGQNSTEICYPANPNGSKGNVAGICNEQGNVFGLMPHPERFVSNLQHPQHKTTGEGAGLCIFKNAYRYVQQLQGPQSTTPSTGIDAYAASGVDVAAGEKAVAMMRTAVKTAQGPEVVAGVGAFAGVFRASQLKGMEQPALVSSTDGVGTKTLLAAQAQRYDTIGYDIVNHSLNDLITQGATPLFFMDYIAVNKLDPTQVATIVAGVAAACKEAGCTLLGGETAEMPDVYQTGAFDLAGTIVGVVEEEQAQNGATIHVGDVIVGFPSNGLHTNGYSLVRKLFAPYALDTVFPELGEPLVDALLRPHRSYLHEVKLLRSHLAERGHTIKGMAHITGGGFEGNISRILPAGTRAFIDTTSWQVPPLFQLIARLLQDTQNETGKAVHPVTEETVYNEELYRTFNMGIGMIVVLTPEAALQARNALPDLITIGNIRSGEGVILR